MKNIIYSMIIFIALVSCSLNAQWVQTNDLYEKDISSLVAFQDRPGTTKLLVGTAGLYSPGSIYLSTNGGLNWIKVDSGWAHSGVTCLVISPSLEESGSTNILAGTLGDGIYLSTNNGSGWGNIDSGLIYGWVNSIAFSAEDSTNMFFAGASNYSNESDIFLSNNYGKKWKLLNFGLTTGAFVNVIAASKDNEGKTNLLVGTDKGIYVINIDEIWWEGFLNRLSNYNISSFAVSGSNIFAGTQNGVFLSSDYGLSWKEMNDGLPKDPSDTSHYISIKTLAVYENETGKRYLFAGSSGQSLLNPHPNVFLSTNNGAWFAVNTGLPLSVNVNAFAFSDGYIYAGTTGRFTGTREKGVWKRLLSNMITDVTYNTVITQEHFDLKQNYPNPFNPSTTIKYQIPLSGNVTLKVYDILGKEVTTLVNERKLPGSYEVKFNATDLSSGIYFYKLQTGSLVETKKMIFLK